MRFAESVFEETISGCEGRFLVLKVSPSSVTPTPPSTLFQTGDLDTLYSSFPTALPSTYRLTPTAPSHPPPPMLNSSILKPQLPTTKASRLTVVGEQFAGRLSVLFNSHPQLLSGLILRSFFTTRSIWIVLVYYIVRSVHTFFGFSPQREVKLEG